MNPLKLYMEVQNILKGLFFFGVIFPMVLISKSAVMYHIFISGTELLQTVNSK